MRCYHCKGNHETVNQVRECATVPAASATVPAFQPPSKAAAKRRAEEPITDKQLNFARKLIATKDISKVADRIPSDVRERDELTALESMTKYDARFLIDFLLGLQDKPREVVAGSKPAGTQLPDVPEGHYAIPGHDDNDEHDIRFYRVDRPTEGKWAGRTFLKVASSDEWFSIRNRAEVERVLLEIAMDPEKARMLYATERVRCTRCNRKLTDKTSRETGMGPECRSK